MDVLGNPPPELNQFRERLTQEQNAARGEKADVDFIFDLPAELAKSVTRFRHDQDTAGMVGDVYHVLEPTAEVAPKTGLIKKARFYYKGNRL